MKNNIDFVSNLTEKVKTKTRFNNVKISCQNNYSNVTIKR